MKMYPVKANLPPTSHSSCPVDHLTISVKRTGVLSRCQSYLINESIWAGVVVGEGFINHQEHDAGEEGQGKDDQNRHLGGGRAMVSTCTCSTAITEDCKYVVYLCETGLGLHP